MTQEAGYSQCSSCGASIMFVKTELGKMVPLCVDPVPNGNIYLDNGVAKYVSKKNPPPKDKTRYVSHFSNCPQAASHRKESS